MRFVLSHNGMASIKLGYIVQPALQYGGWNVLIISVQEGDGLHIRSKLTVTAYGYLWTLVIASRENRQLLCSIPSVSVERSGHNIAVRYTHPHTHVDAMYS